MMKRVVAAVLAINLAVAPALAQDCSTDVQSAQESARQTYIQGMTGLAGSNFSNRPGTFSSLGCLDKFMQGNMDVFFRPPQLNDLLGMVLNFACQQLQQKVGAAGGAGGGIGNLTSLLGGLAGGLNVPSAGGGSSLVNLNQVLGYGSSVNSSGGSLNGLFSGR